MKYKSAFQKRLDTAHATDRGGREGSTTDESNLALDAALPSALGGKGGSGTKPTERVGIGDRFPSFTLPDQNGTAFILDEVLGKGAVVLFFYPKDGTPGCTREACSFRDASAEFLEAGALVAGISSDDSASHQRFAARHGLDYPLLEDAGGLLRKKVGVRRSMFGLADGRVTYVLDSNGVVRHVYDSLLGVNQHVEEALVTVRGLGGGQR